VSNVYLLIDPPGDALVNVELAVSLCANDSPQPSDRGHIRLGLDRQQAIVHGTLSEQSIDALLSQEWAVMSYDHAQMLGYLDYYRTEWERNEEP